MKKLVLLPIVIAAAVWFAPGSTHAEQPVSLLLNGKKLTAEVPPKIVGDGTTMVPVRIIAEELGSKVDWNQDDYSVKVEKGGMLLAMKVGSREASAGGKPVTLEEAPILEDGNTLLPIRFVAEQMGLVVNWDQAANAVRLADKADKPSDSSGAGGKGGGTGNSQTPTPAPGTAGLEQLPANMKPGSNEIYYFRATEDQLIIKSTGELKPKLFELPGPDRLVIDLPDATIGSLLTGTDSTHSGEIASVHPKIAKIRYSLFSAEPTISRIVVDLKEKIDYTLIESNNPKELIVSLKAPSQSVSPTPTPTPSSKPSTSPPPAATPSVSPSPTPSSKPGAVKYKVVIDAGHGGDDVGAESVSDRYEKDFNLSVASRVYKYLSQESQIQVIMTRYDDTFIELDDRVKIANDFGASVFVSIHGNKFEKESVNGVETYYNRADSKELAEVLHPRILEATGFANRNVRTEDFRVIKYTKMPAVLCEIGYLSNKVNESVMYNSKKQDDIAKAIAEGIKAYLQNK